MWIDMWHVRKELRRNCEIRSAQRTAVIHFAHRTDRHHRFMYSNRTIECSSHSISFLDLIPPPLRLFRFLISSTYLVHAAVCHVTRIRSGLLHSDPNKKLSRWQQPVILNLETLCIRQSNAICVVHHRSLVHAISVQCVMILISA